MTILLLHDDEEFRPGLADHWREAGHAVNTRLALLGTLGHLHTEPLRYDLACLRSLVEALEPDLLGVEVEPNAWERDDLSAAPVEVREGLVPAARRTDTVIVPLASPSPRSPSEAIAALAADPRIVSAFGGSP